MTEEQRLIKAKISLLINEPWFGQLACYLNLHPTDKIDTAGINERGDLFFNPDFIKNLTDEELKGVVCHEILHLAFQHPWRCQSRDKLIFNVAADLKVNSELANRRDLTLPKGSVVIDYNNTWTFGKIVIKDVVMKTTEQIYDEMYRVMKKLPGIIFDLIGGNSAQDEKEKQIAQVPGHELKGLAKEWAQRIQQANGSVQKGDIPAGLRRELDTLVNPELPWTQIIRERFSRITKRKTWRRCNRKYLPFFFPGSWKDLGLNAVCVIDTSGSMDEEDLTKAVSEILGLADSFPAVHLYIISNDADVWGEPIEVKNGNREKIKHLELQGGGGTDFRPAFELVTQRWSSKIDCLIFFTDGYGDFPEKAPGYQTYWITQSDDVTFPFGKVIHFRPRGRR